MYQAIVFLPLLGAILAGLIAIAGARARFPGEGPLPGDEDSGHASAACGAWRFGRARSARPRRARA